jgi:hypothetical protein
MDQSGSCFFPLAPEYYNPWPQPYINGQTGNAPILQQSSADGNPLETGHSWELSIAKRRQSEPASNTLQPQDIQFVTFNGKCFVGPTRVPLTEQSRNKIRKVREKGACLRCRIRKISVRRLCQIIMRRSSDLVISAMNKTHAINVRP